MDGIIIIDKPQGVTSHDVVDFIRRKFGLKKVGHAGTLDPMATGVLVMLIGSFTKYAGQFITDDKDYEATLTLGAVSDTGDAWGTLASSEKEINITKDEIESAFRKFLGPTEQHPPMYSAVKFKGKKLYELARKGVQIKLKPRKIVINRLDITGIALPQVSFKLTCSKGTYVRQLCADIGEELKCGAHLSRLQRTRSGRFNIGDALSFDELRSLSADDLSKRIRRL